MRVLGRTDEIAVIDDFVDGLVDGVSTSCWVLLILGVLGIGKTTLWDHAIARGRAQGMYVLVARPVEAETPLGFAALSDLFADLPNAVVDELPPPQRRALRIALLREDVGDDPADPRSVATAALGALRAFSRQAPVLLAVDDLPWLDAESARVLAFVLRRLTAEPIGLVAAARMADDTTPVDGLPTEGVDPTRVSRVVAGSLSLGALRELLTERVGFAGTRRDLVRLHDASGGNPLFALELARTLDTTTAADGQLRVPPTLRYLVQGRVTGLSAPVRDLLLLTALSTDPRAETLSRAAGPTAQRDLGTATEHGILAVDGGDVAFTHPLLRSVVSGDASAEQRRDAHHRLAAVLTSPIERARHLALAADAPDEQVAAALDEAARETHLQGALETAAELGELALVVSPSPAPDRAVAAAAYRFDAGDPERGRDLLAGVVDRSPPGPERSAWLVRLATYERYCGEALPVWRETLRRALAEGADDINVSIGCHLELGFAAFNCAEFEEGGTHIRACMDLVDRCTDRVLAAQVNAGIAWAGFAGGQGIETGFADRAMTQYRSSDRLPAEVRPPYTLAMMYMHAGDLERARALLDAERAATRDRGDESALVVVEWLLVCVESFAGKLTRAEQVAAEGLRAAELSGMQAGVALLSAARALLQATQGRVADARAEATRAVSLADELALTIPSTFAREAMAQLALSLSDPQGAYDVLAPTIEVLHASAGTEPTMARGLPDGIEALIRIGRLDQAERLLEPYARRALQLDRGWAIVSAQRCAGLLHAARGELPAAEAELELALTRAPGLGMPIEAGRTLLVAGEIHRRARHKRLAQQRLEDARACFDQVAAAQWSARCAAELDRIRPGAQHGALTEMEQRVADLAASGQTSREIAGALFTSVRTVEAHLQRVYAKLGVHSRVELSRRLGP